MLRYRRCVVNRGIAARGEIERSPLLAPLRTLRLKKINRKGQFHAVNGLPYSITRYCTIYTLRENLV